MATKKKTERKPLEFYLELKYPVTLYPDEDGGYVAQIKDLPGCMTQGDTLDETIFNIEEARSLWIETAYEHGKEIPLPSTEIHYSGKFLLRMPCFLHRQLVESAEREKVSLNQYILALLSQRDATKTIHDLSDKLDKISNSLSQPREVEVSAKDNVLKTLLKEFLQSESSIKKFIDEQKREEASSPDEEKILQ